MRLQRVTARIYRVALLAFPENRRAEYGAEMVETFERALAARVRAHGSWAAARFAVAAWLDATAAGLSERNRQRGQKPGGVMGIGMSWLDVKLGIRMLVRYPGLSIAGALGIAMVIVCGTVAGIFDAVVNGKLPFEEGDRVVAIENWDTSANRPAPHDFLSWRHDLQTIEDVGAYRLIRRNVAAAGLPPEPVRVAEISAAAFTLARVPPLLGRYLTRDDERDNAAPVIVIREDEWQRRFAGDPHVLGRTLKVGDTEPTIVGVMPKSFGFPVNERYWIPLRLTSADLKTAQAPSNMPFKAMPPGGLYVFGRLAEGADLGSAQAELAVAGRRAADTSPVTHAHVRPRVLPYSEWFFDEQHDGEIYLVQGLVALLLAIVGANVAVLVYARTATRQIEIALRSALGASRRRIVGQMFVEGLALSGVAAATGLVIAIAARRQLDALITWEQAPFWVNTSVTSGTVFAYVLALAVLGAVMVGVVPALQATGRRAQTGLQQAAAGSSRWKIGRTYGALIVVQVAVAVAVLPYALSTTWTSIREAVVDPGFPAEEFLTARLEIEQEMTGTAAVDERFRQRRTELARRLESEAGVSAVTFLTGVPGSEPTAPIEIEGEGSREVAIGRIGPDFLEVFDVAVLAGRKFDAGDVDASSRHVIVNRAFAQDLLGGNALGRRVREAGSLESSAPWLEVIGVVEDFPARATQSTLAEARLYYPVPPGDARFALMAVRLRGKAPADFAPRLREITMDVDPRLQLRDIRSMDALLWDQHIGSRVGAWVSGLLTLSLLLLSATGLYALMSFTVTQRQKEIGIRIALGADAHRLLSSVFARAFRQLAAGILIGVTVAAFLNMETGRESTGGGGLAMLPLVALFVLLVGLGAAAGPARRGLRIQPTEAMREQ